MDLHLLLARPGRGAVTPAGLESAAAEPLPPAPPPQSHLFDSSDLNSLPKQKWALVVPEGSKGDRLESILKPLRELRECQQKAPIEVLKVPPRMNEEQALQYRDRHLRPAARSMKAWPRYLLFAGEPDEVPFELQEAAGGDGACFVGRLAFEQEANYEAYVAKVVERETRPGGAREARVILASVADGSSATTGGHKHLVMPLGERCRKESRLGNFNAGAVTTEVVPKGSADPLLRLAGAPEPAVLFTLSHGLGAPPEGWRDAQQQRREQGCLFLDGDKLALMPEDIGGRPFVPGGIWFYFACFGAGTPPRSIYQPWLEHLAERNPSNRDTLESLRISRPLDGRPFVGQLARAALANPRGPVAIIAHHDIAFSYSFCDGVEGNNHAHRFVTPLAELVDGRRAGIALNALSHFAREVDQRIRLDDQKAAAAHRVPLRGDDLEIRRAHRWMERHDLMSYVLLGDPAAHLVLAGARDG